MHNPIDLFDLEVAKVDRVDYATKKKSAVGAYGALWEKVTQEIEN